VEVNTSVFSADDFLVGSLGRFLRLGAVAAAIGCLALVGGVASAAAETVTVGTVLPLDETAGVIQAEATEAGGFLSADATAPSSGAVAPFDGTVTAWRVEGSAAGGAYSISTLRPEPDGTLTITGVSPTVSPLGFEFSTVETFDTSLPVMEGEYVALDFTAGSRFGAEESPSLAMVFSGSAAIGKVVSDETTESPFTFGYNVDIEKAPPVITPPVETPPAPTSPVTTTPAPPAVSPAPGCVVPKLVGKKPAQARKALRAAHCKVGHITHGHGAKAAAAKVVKQSPKPGATRAANSPVALKVG
jgi:hypothetical protein